MGLFSLPKRRKAAEKGKDSRLIMQAFFFRYCFSLFLKRYNFILTAPSVSPSTSAILCSGISFSKTRYIIICISFFCIFIKSDMYFSNSYEEISEKTSNVHLIRLMGHFSFLQLFFLAYRMQ